MFYESFAHHVFFGFTIFEFSRGAISPHLDKFDHAG
jgi:hypothetical protein